MTPTELRAALEQDGWHFGAQNMRDTGVSWYAWKRAEGFTDCTNNEKPPSVCITPWQLTMQTGQQFFSTEFEVTGQVGGDDWMTLRVYSVPMDECLAKIPRATELLKAAWNAAAGLHAGAEPMNHPATDAARRVLLDGEWEPE